VAVAATALVGVAATLCIAFVPNVRFAYDEPGLRLALAASVSMVSLFAAFLLLGRFRAAARLDALVAALALLQIAATNFFLGALPDALASGGRESTAWSAGAVAGRVVADLLLCLAAFAPARRFAVGTGIRVAIASGAAFVLAVAVTMAEVRFNAPAGSLPLGASRPYLHGHVVILGIQLTTTLAYAAAAVGFARKSKRYDDELLGFLAVASTLGAVARLNYALYPALYPGELYTGDVFRALSYTLLLVGAFREISRYWHNLADEAAAKERRRIARDVHDGVAQELAYIVREAQRLDLPPDVLHAAERGLDESRLALQALDQPLDEPLERALVRVTEDVATRNGTRIDFALAAGIEASAIVRETLMRIAREAVQNAARHGNPSVVHVSLERDPRLRLRIADDGSGFDPAAVGERGYGLITMRERAEALGGCLSLRSRRGSGTEIEVILP
jgi:signal transduction histidine kinase